MLEGNHDSNGWDAGPRQEHFGSLNPLLDPSRDSFKGSTFRAEIHCTLPECNCSACDRAVCSVTDVNNVLKFVKKSIVDLITKTVRKDKNCSCVRLRFL